MSSPRGDIIRRSFLGELPEVGESWIYDNPENVCFGCSPNNPRGLQLSFTRVAEHRVEVHFRPDPHLAGAPGVMHGGIQATLLDEAMGATSRTSTPKEHVHFVTAEFKLRYRRPVPAEAPLVIWGQLVREEGHDLYLEGGIENAEGELLTAAEARWRRLR